MPDAQFKSSEKCPECNGTGITSAYCGPHSTPEDWKCEKCNGVGRIYKPIFDVFLRNERIIVKCLECGQEFTEFPDVVSHPHINVYINKRMKEFDEYERSIISYCRIRQKRITKEVCEDCTARFHCVTYEFLKSKAGEKL